MRKTTTSFDQPVARARVALTVAVVLLLSCDKTEDDSEAADVPADTNTEVSTDSVSADTVFSDGAPDRLVDAPEPSLQVTTSSQRAPQPAHLLFLRLDGDDLGQSIHVQGILRETELWVDVDGTDDQFPFWVQLYDEDSELLFQSTHREPIQIREYLHALGVFPEGANVFDLFPELAGFAVRVPADDRIARAVFSRREADGSLTELSTATWSALDEVEPYEAAAEYVHGSALPSEAVDITFLADGYTADELDEFAAHVDIAISGFLEEEPYASYADRINFHRVDAVSVESGAGYDCSDEEDIPGCADRLKDTAFGSFFPVRIGRALVEGTDWVMFQREQAEVWRAAALTPFDAVVVLVNTPKTGGFGLWVTSLNGQNERLKDGVVHEFGHSFGLLADEYLNGTDPCQQFVLTPDFPNLSEHAETPNEVKWSYWLTPEVPLPTPEDAPEWEDSVGLFRGVGGGCADLYRPVKRCLMRSWSGHLCPVCTEQTIRRIYQNIDLLGDPGVTVVEGQLRAELLSASTEGEWWLDGELAGQARDGLTIPESVETAPLEVTLRVWDPTEWVQPDTPEVREEVQFMVEWR